MDLEQLISCGTVSRLIKEVNATSVAFTSCSASPRGWLRLFNADGVVLDLLVSERRLAAYKAAESISVAALIAEVGNTKILKVVGSNGETFAIGTNNTETLDGRFAFAKSYELSKD